MSAVTLLVSDWIKAKYKCTHLHTNKCIGYTLIDDNNSDSGLKEQITKKQIWS